MSPIDFKNQSKRAFSMIELLLGVALLAVGIIPLFTIGSQNTKQAFNARKHIIASEIARSVLNRYRALSFLDCRRALGNQTFPIRVQDDTMVGEVLAATVPNALRKDFARDLKSIAYSVVARYDRMIDPCQVHLRVIVSYPAGMSKNSTRVILEMEAVKFREIP